MHFAGFGLQRRGLGHAPIACVYSHSLSGRQPRVSKRNQVDFQSLLFGCVSSVTTAQPTAEAIIDECRPADIGPTCFILTFHFLAISMQMRRNRC